MGHREGLLKAAKKFKYYFVFRRALPFISVLIFVHAWVEYAVVAILITHLNENLVNLPKAAAIVNVQDGISAFLVLLVSYTSDAFLGPFLAVVSTSLAYICGLWLLYFAADRPKSTEIKTLYAAVIFVGLGRAGRSISLKEFLADQFRANGLSIDENQVESRRKTVWRLAYCLGIIASVSIYNSASWIQLCKAAGIAMVVAFMVLLIGSAFYEYKKPADSGTTSNLLRVSYAAIAKRRLSHTCTGVVFLRWLDKAAVVESSTSVDEQKRKARLCTAQQVEQAKTSLSMVPFCMTFLVYGLLQATGNTFFFEQLNFTNNRLGVIHNVPIIIFVVIKSFTGMIVSWICDYIFPFFWGDRIPRSVLFCRIGGGMAIAPLCCLLAYEVESYRVQQYVDYNVSVSGVLLAPQFVLLGMMDGLVFDGLVEVYYSMVPRSLGMYGPTFAEFTIGFGHFLGLLSVVIFRNYFGENLDESRLGAYYRNLGYVCLVNLFVYSCIASCYLKDGPRGAQAMKQSQQLEDNTAAIIELVCNHEMSQDGTSNS